MNLNLGPPPQDPLAHIPDPGQRLRLRREQRRSATLRLLSDPSQLGALRGAPAGDHAICHAARAAHRLRRTLDQAFETRIALRPADTNTVMLLMEMARTCEEAGREAEFLQALEGLPHPERAEIRVRLEPEFLLRLARATRPGRSSGA